MNHTNSVNTTDQRYVKSIDLLKVMSHPAYRKLYRGLKNTYYSGRADSTIDNICVAAENSGWDGEWYDLLRWLMDLIIQDLEEPVIEDPGRQLIKYAYESLNIQITVTDLCEIFLPALEDLLSSSHDS